MLGNRLRAAGVEAVVVDSPDDSHSSINRDIGRAGHLPTAAVAAVLDRVASAQATPAATDDDAKAKPDG